MHTNCIKLGLSHSIFFFCFYKYKLVFIFELTKGIEIFCSLSNRCKFSTTNKQLEEPTFIDENRNTYKYLNFYFPCSKKQLNFTC